jgi:hypothetical protein
MEGPPDAILAIIHECQTSITLNSIQNDPNKTQSHQNYFIIKDHTTRYHFGKNCKKGIKNELQLL